MNPDALVIAAAASSTRISVPSRDTRISREQVASDAPMATRRTSDSSTVRVAMTAWTQMNKSYLG